MTATDAFGYAISRAMIDGEWGHRNAYRALYKQQQEAKPRPPELPPKDTSLWKPWKPQPSTPSDSSNSTNRHGPAWEALVRLSAAMFVENLRGQVNLLASIGNALIKHPELLATLALGIAAIVAGGAGTGGGAVATATGVGAAPGVPLTAGSIALIGTGVAAVGVASAGVAAAVVNDGGIEIWQRNDDSVASRDVHGQLRKEERDVDVPDVLERGDLYYQEDGQLVRVLSNGDDTFSVVIRDPSNPSTQPTTVIERLTERQLQRKLADGEWW